MIGENRERRITMLQEFADVFSDFVMAMLDIIFDWIMGLLEGFTAS